MTPPVALTIAGVDSAGGAGVHADIRAFAAHRVHGATAVSALTAQDTTGIAAVHLVPPAFLAQQVEVVVADLDIRATKTGLLGSVAAVEAVAHAARAPATLGSLVVDPVLVTAGGVRLFGPDLDAAYLRLFASAVVITPNRVEAGLLLGRELPTVADMAAAASELRETGASWVVVKGGDAEDEGDESIDVVAGPQGVTRLTRPRVDTANDHGSGCSFAAAIAASLARETPVAVSIGRAKDFVHAALVGARDWRLGAGHGPIDAFGWGADG